MKKIALIAIAVLLLTACTQKKATSTDQPVTSTTPVASAMVEASPTETLTIGPLSFKLAALNSSKQDGTATLEEVDGKIKVTLNVEGGVTTAEPAHIHTGSCPTPGDVKYTLTNVVNGKSETTLPSEVTVSALKDMGALAINIHKSGSDLKTYVSCGNLDWSTATKGSAMMSAAPKASTGVMKQ